MKKTLILIFIIGFLALAGYLFYHEGTLAVNKASNEKVIFVIEPGQNLDSIINKLSSENLIRNRIVFYLIVKQKGIERKIQAGDFRLSPAMNASEIAEELTHGTLDIWVTIPEGKRKEEIAEILSERVGISETEFNQLADEGYLFPDTYLIPKNPTTQQVIDLLTNTMNTKYEEVAADAEKKGLSKLETLILASLVEREASGPDDRQEIANIIYKRVVNDWPLNIDATIQYALGYQPAEKSWWTQRLTQADYQGVKSDYNTYLNTGLPPAPISNPGFESIKAVVYADPDTKNWFYYHDKDGKVYFAEKLEDHEENSTN